MPCFGISLLGRLHYILQHLMGILFQTTDTTLIPQRNKTQRQITFSINPISSSVTPTNNRTTSFSSPNPQKRSQSIKRPPMPPLLPTRSIFSSIQRGHKIQQRRRIFQMLQTWSFVTKGVRFSLAVQSFWIDTYTFPKRAFLILFKNYK